MSHDNQCLSMGDIGCMYVDGCTKFTFIGCKHCRQADPTLGKRWRDQRAIFQQKLRSQCTQGYSRQGRA